MKKFIKPLLYVVAAALLVVSGVLGTLAFLASSSAVSNTFTYGKVAIEMFESKTDKNGVIVEAVPGQKTSDGNSYELVPGKNYVKDPSIYVKAESTPSYLFVKVKNGIQTIEVQGDAGAPTIKQQMVANGWQLVKSNDAGEELFLYVGFDGVGNTKAVIDKDNDAVAYQTVGGHGEEVIDIFEEFTVSEEAAVADYAGAKVTLTAFAIQLDTFEEVKDGLEGYQRAWNAIVGRFPYESGTQYQAQANP